MLKADATNAKKNHAPRAMKPPAYRERVPYGQAIVTLTDSRTKKRRDYWLGAMNSAASRELYFRVLAAWESNGRRWPEVPGTSGRTAATLIDSMNDEPALFTINELVRDYWAWANGYYSGSELSSLKVALRLLRRMFGSTPAIEFGPKRLRLVRDDMVRGDANGDPPRIPWSRKHTNGQIHRIGAMFKWASAHEKLPVTVYQQLKSMPALKRGRSDARETESVKPVALELVAATKPLVSRQVRALIELQLFTGARGGELFKLRSIDLKTDGQTGVWTTSPPEHKTAHHGHDRTIYFGPKAQAVLKPFLDGRPAHAYLFSPTEAEQERLAAKAKARKTPLSCGNRPGTNKLAVRPKPLKNHYTADTYRRAIERGCRKAFPCPDGLTLIEQRVWRDEHHWHPHQLRHAAATLIRKEHGLEMARIVLGHSSALVTDAVYAQRDMGKVAEVMRQIG